MVMMEKEGTVSAALLLLLVALITCSNANRETCTSLKSVSTVQAITTYSEDPQVTTYQSCFGGIWPCTERTKTEYVRKSQVTYQTVHMQNNVATCCNGYTGTPPICNDINECHLDNGGCSQQCHNTDGSYFCACDEEYTLTNDGKTCTDSTKSLKKRSADESKHFYFGFPHHFNSGNYQHSLIITAYDAAVSYKVEGSSGPITSGTLPALSSHHINIDAKYSVETPAYQYRDKGIHVSTNGEVSLLAVSSGSAATGEYPVFPYESLDSVTEYVYFAVSTGSKDYGIVNKFGHILLVGNENATSITITPTANINIPINPQLDSSIITLYEGNSKTFILNEYETLLITATTVAADLTGTKIVSNKPLSVITGHECGNIPKNTNYCETILQQVPPTVSWGIQFMISPYQSRTSQFFKIVASESSTSFSYNCGGSTYTGFLYSAGSFTTIETFSTNYCYIEATKAILVTQMSPSAKHDQTNGDPAISVIPPMERYIKTYSFYIPNPGDFLSAYLNIITKEKVTFTLNGVTLSPSWNTITDNGGNTVGYGAQLFDEISFTTAYKLTTSADAEFYTLAYAFGINKAISFPPAVSTCNKGYKLVNNNCSDIDECATNQDDCDANAVCTNTLGSYLCSCGAGFTLNNTDGAVMCDDINECNSITDDCHHCTNTNGSYICTCDEGYELIGKDFCNDKDECAANTDSCNQTCNNIIGSYTCDCYDGYYLKSDKMNCEDKDECLSNNGGCSPLALSTCNNTLGSYHCLCNDGYHLDTMNDHLCIDTNECAYEDCPQKCVNTPGSYYCQCLPGYSGKNCDNINECDTANGGCSHTCTDTEGSYYCTCDNGYTVHSDKHSCENVNECITNNGGCEHKCKDNPGSYTCLCVSGYSLDIDGKGCTPDCPIDCVVNHCSECVSPNQCNCDPGWTGSDCCTDINECSVNKGGCEQYCHNVDGSFACSCDPNGYTLNSNGFDCDDICECCEGTHECSDGCTNTVGSYLCYCPTGYELNAGLKTCVDTDECKIQNGGCDSDNGECINNDGSYYCQCNSGYQLGSDSHSCDDLCECTLGIDNCSGECINNVGSYTCDCEVGYTLNSDGLKCDDVNECAVHNGGCDHTCVNTKGSYHCECNTGFYLLDNNHDCSDHDECKANTDACSQNCHNSQSSYYCSCKIGYTLDPDGVTCNDINECTEHISGCTQYCSNTIGSYTCSCYTGFTLNSNGKTCNDINECYTNNGGCDQSCENNVGSYECYCNSGYILASDKTSCNDLDECSLNTDKCAHSCTNTDGSYTCSCNTGYTLGSNGLQCDDIDECQTNDGGCDDRCVNTAGSYHCECDKEGYTLTDDKHSCVDINECYTNKGDCEHTCVNTAGSYYCECNNGYSLDGDDKGCSPVCDDSCNQCTECVSPGLCTCDNGWTGNDCCKDINECNTLNGGCAQTCHNAQGSFICTCSEGYTLGSNGKSCIDNDECTDGTHLCNQMCTNTVGSYKCSCNSGYELGLDKRTCVDTDECAVSNGGCKHDCSNSIGSYECSCLDGYVLNSNDHDCDDVDECSMDTDECSHTCYNNVGSYTCDCEMGYELNSDDLQCINTDECAVDNGGCDDYCHDTDGSYYCTCKVGSKLLEDDHGCTDVIECEADTDNCDQVCHNTKYSYYCTCNDGYKLDVDGHTCIDINECADLISGCNHVCTNTEGSYVCSCYSGFVLTSGQKICEDINECNNGNGGCDDTCTNNDGSYKCSCHDGYELDNDQHQCIDIKECDTANGGCAYTCTNTIGSYYCTCNNGYTLQSDKHTCKDVNECDTNNGGCEHNCNNNPGSYTCSCDPGYSLDIDDKGCTSDCPIDCAVNHCSECVSPNQCNCDPGWTGSDCCTDINECSVNKGGCEQYCHNVDGSFACSCDPNGYTLKSDGFDCDDINECSKGTHECSNGCTNTVGSYLCYCPTGYELDAGLKTCVDTDECEVQNGGCDSDNGECINNDGSYYCQCNSGYQLGSDSHSCDDKDECTLGIDNCSGECINNVGSYTCDCEVGYTLNSNGLKCDDVNECAVNNGGCDHTCVNTNGSYHCECNTGFYLLDNNHDCSDHDECKANTDACSQNCHNSQSSYYCSCNISYTLNPDGVTCNDINECTEHISGCTQYCSNTIGSYTCSCYTGFTLNSNGKTCNDINECYSNNGGCTQSCANNDGSYECYCNSGYILASDKTSCNDLDECSLNTDKCAHSCTNTDGLYTCSCNTGYILGSNGLQCDDIDECQTNDGGCDDRCVNTAGSYHCECDKEGYTLSNDKHTCVDINECDTNKDGCEHTCVNTEGDYYCDCDDGYNLEGDDKGCSPVCDDSCNQCTECVSPGLCTCDDGWTGNDCCKDINECNTLNGGCAQTCHNAQGSFTCTCSEGYTLGSNGKSCIDNDECTDGTHLCNQMCTNTVGSYKCSCNSGYELGLDKRTCVDTDECAVSNGGCEHDCSNSIGSYECSCLDGYVLNSNGHDCDDVDECSMDTDECSHTCYNNVGSYTCDCEMGYELNSDDLQCINTDECAVDNGGCDDYCHDTDGSYYCTCKVGSKLLEDDHGCTDVIECEDDTDNCDQVCHNTKYSYYCTCNDGYKLDVDGHTCIDINECADLISGCNQVCTNTEGSYECSCYSGFVLNSGQKICEDINECNYNNGGCDDTCTNNDGSYKCSCDNGYELDNDQHQCNDIPECELSIDTCEHICENTIGTFTCKCKSGFELSVDGVHCSNINECEDHNGDCGHNCIDTTGSYYCICDDGYKLDDDGLTCQDINECLDDNGGCDQLCNNTNDGSYFCTCNNGYLLDIDDKGCLPICPDKCGNCIECVNPNGCSCSDGWTGNDCCEDIDECDAYNAGCQQICHNGNGSFVCECRDGYTTDDHGYTCDNINECLSSDTNNCNQQCTDTSGSYLCYCDEGYNLGIDYFTCEDIVECGINNGGCSQTCVNEIGSYYCQCNVGYALNLDGHACDDVNECLDNIHNCSHNCSNTVGSYTCDCDPGYTITDADLFTCVDIDECADGNGGCEQKCNNEIGTYNCSCLDGYLLDEDGKGCSDHLECETGVHKCDQHCHNSHNSYYCTCDFGYILEADGRTCTDINECEDHLASCNQICINTNGSYDCDCIIGYELKPNNRTCIDIDECSFDNGGCNQTCVNTTGSYKCSCDVGYKLNNNLHGCDDIDECTLGIDLCEHNCFNNFGSYHCACDVGYFLEGNGFNCTDVNECDTDNGGCNQTCVNKIGSYHCECDDGFLLSEDLHACIDINECNSDNAGCQQNCHNHYGTYSCSCFDGYDLLGDTQSCYGQKCNETLIAPINGTINCTGEQITNETCYFRCNPGYDLQESSNRSCEANHVWTGVEPYCTIKSCDNLQRPWNGFIVSDPCFTKFTSQCEVQCVDGYTAEDISSDQFYQECRADPKTNTMYWSDPPNCIYIPPCTSNPCLNGGVCRDVTISEYKCDCLGTHYKGIRCDVGIVKIPQVPIITNGGTATVTMEAYPPTGLQVHLTATGNGIEFISSSTVSFDTKSTTASLTIRGLASGIHFINFNLSGENALTFDKPKPMIVIVLSNTTQPNHFHYFDDQNQTYGILKEGCCEKKSNYFSCSDPDIDLSLLSSCSWAQNIDETFGIVFARSQNSSVPVGIAGVRVQDHYPFVTLPSLQYSCTSCNTSCPAYNLNEEDIIDFIKLHALARTWIEHTSSYLPDWIKFIVNKIDSFDINTPFYSYDVITDVVQGKDVILIDSCENLDISSEEFYSVLRYNDTLAVSVDGIEYSYQPRYMDIPVCFAVSLCDKESPIHVSIPSGHQEDLEQIDVIKNFVAYGWLMEIFEVSLSAKANNVSFTMPVNTNSSQNFDSDMMAEYQMRMELRFEKTSAKGNTTVSLVSKGITAYLIPEEQTTPFQGLMIGDIHLYFNSTINGQIASLAIEQLPTLPIPFVLPGYSSENSAWSNGAYLQFNYVPADLDQFFSTILPSDSKNCPANMFVTFDADDHNIDSMVMTTSCLGLNILGISLPAGTLEHKITIELDSMIKIESKIIDGDYQVNEFMKIKQPTSGYAVSVTFYTNGTVIGEIKDVHLAILGTVFSTTLYISDKLTFSTNLATTIYNIHLENDMFGVFGSSKSSQSLVLYVNSEVTDMNFIKDVNTYTTSFIMNEIHIFNNRLDTIMSSKQPIEKLFYFYSDVVSKLQQELNVSSVLYETAVEQVEDLGNLLDQYQNDVNALQLAKVHEILSVCGEGNCSDICAIQKVCGTCNGNYLVSHWGLGLMKEEENILVNYKKDIDHKEWKVGYFCRLITNINSWGKTSYGQICSYKSGYDVEMKPTWVSEYSNCNVSLFKSVEIDTYLTPLNEICLLHDTCGMNLQPSECVITDSACRIAQLQMINSLNGNEALQLQPLKNLLETKAALSIAFTQAEEYRYRRNIANCSLAFNQNILKSLHSQISEIDISYDNLSIDLSFLREIESLQFNTSEDLFKLIRISFEVTIDSVSPESFPLLLLFEVPVLNASSEISVTVDFSSPKSIIKRDIASAVLKNLVGLTKNTNNRRKRSCDVVTEPSHNEHHFEQYCVIIDSVKNYLQELNNTIQFVAENTDDLKLEFMNLIEYVLLEQSDKNFVDFDIDIDKLNSFLNSTTSKDELLDSSFSSEEYVIIAESLKNIESILDIVASTIDNSTIVAWWNMMNGLHLTSYNRIIDDRKCYGFIDCLKTVVNILQEITNNSFSGINQIVDSNKFQLAEQMALSIISGVYVSNDTWSHLEPLYQIALDVESNTDWCIEAPVITAQPDPFVYVELGSNTEIICGGPSNVRYSWLKNGFPIIDNNVDTLRLNQVDEHDEGQYQCSIENAAGKDLSAISEVRVYVPPVIAHSPSNMSTFEGNEDDGLFICNATGYPTPVYKWYFSINKLNWELVGNGSNEYVVYKPTKARQGWYKCRAIIYEHEDESGAAYLSVIGASISKISYKVNFTMAIFILCDLNNSTESYTGDSYISGLHEIIINTIKQTEVWRFGYIEHLKTSIDFFGSQLHVSFDLSTHYDYSLIISIADQAEEADMQNFELLTVLNNMKMRLNEASISFDYVHDFMYAFPQTLTIADAMFTCPDGQRLLENTFICVDCPVGYHSAVVNNIPTCVKCERGTYNGLAGQSNCIACPEHMSTLETALITDEKCSDLCPPDTYSSDGFVNSVCINCTNSTYQPDYGSTSCICCETILPPRVDKYVYLVLTVVAIAVFTIIIVTIVISVYKWNSKRTRDNVDTRGLFSNGRQGDVLPDFGPHCERHITNPLYQTDPNAVYDQIGLNPMYFEVEEVNKTDSDSRNGDYPLYTEYQNQRGANVRRLRTEFESIQTSRHSYNEYEPNQEEGPLQLDNEEDFFKLATNESDSIDDLPMNTYETVPYNH